MTLIGKAYLAWTRLNADGERREPVRWKRTPNMYRIDMPEGKRRTRPLFQIKIVPPLDAEWKQEQPVIGPREPLKCTPIWDDLGCSGIPGEGVGHRRNRRHRRSSPGSGNPTVEGGGATRTSLKPTPFWDDLGCGGIPGEGGAHSRNQPDREEIGGIESMLGGTGITISVSTHA
jgi:hypothetical protein